MKIIDGIRDNGRMLKKRLCGKDKNYNEEILYQMKCVKKYISSIHIHATAICILGHTEQNLAYSVQVI